MASWPQSQRTEDWVVWAGFLSLPSWSLQLINMKPRAGRSWPLSCQRIAHLESRKAFLGAPRSWPRSLPPRPDGQWSPLLSVLGSLCPSPHLNSPVTPTSSCALVFPLCAGSLGRWMVRPRFSGPWGSLHICQRALGLRPWGFTPKGRGGLDVGQFVPGSLSWF